MVKLTSIAENISASSLDDADAAFEAACQAIALHDLTTAYAILNRLAHQPLPPEMKDAARIMCDVLNPGNTPAETAEKFLRSLPPVEVLRVYDRNHG